VVKVASEDSSFTFRLDRTKLRRARLRERRYLLRTNLPKDDPAKLWDYYIRLVDVEQAFKTLKDDLAIRPLFYQREARIEAHIFILYRLSGLQPACNAASTIAGVHPRPDAARRAGRLRRRADDRCARADNGRARADADAIYQAGTGVALTDRETEDTTPGSAAAQDHRQPAAIADADVVKTFARPHHGHQWVSSRSDRESAKLG
jgi:hypothetical protein